MSSKKKKPVQSEFSTVNVEAEVSGEASGVADMSESDKLLEKSGTIRLSISDEIKQKLDAVDKLTEQNAGYAKQVSELQDRIAEYIQEIAELKEQAAKPAVPADGGEDMAALKAEIARLKAELEANKRKPEPRPEVKSAPKPPFPQGRPGLSPNCYRRRIIGEYPTWN